MQHQSLFVFDIETVPDTNAVPNLTGFTEPGVDARREELERYHLDITGGKNPFPRQPFHRVVAISFLAADIERDGKHEAYFLKELRSGGKEDSSEADLLKGFFGYIDRFKPRLVSYNGRGFDLPVLKYRAMVHGVSASGLLNSGDKWNSYTSRYSADWHCDLLEVLSDFGASAKCKLNEVCAALGLPGKVGVDGSKVAGMFDNGEIKAIRDYCESDVLNTYLVYLRYQLLTGNLSKEVHNRAVSDVVTLIEGEQEDRPHLGEFIDAWGEACNFEFMVK